MARMTEEEANRLDVELTETIPTFTSGEPGVFARQKDMIVVLDGFTSRYLTSKMLTTKKSPADIISEMVHKEMRASVS